ncbi:DEBR0S1_05138g1_1 [Brettanomyces bruxellensis]|uniref:DEBR0S1_05138g1_1 n=1 Tax=Dekkera bruxellensis TaxID=5007 RepID=A0A7D9H1B9_DEKBR|nr:DEBR0S1_05138g1_1 [Brettanomyces bruxellensis]
MSSTMTQSGYRGQPGFRQPGILDTEVLALNDYDDHSSTIERAGLRQTSLSARLNNQRLKKHKTKAQIVLNSNASIYSLSNGSNGSTPSLYAQPPGVPYANSAFNGSSGSLTSVTHRPLQQSQNRPSYVNNGQMAPPQFRQPAPGQIPNGYMSPNGYPQPQQQLQQAQQPQQYQQFQQQQQYQQFQQPQGMHQPADMQQRRFVQPAQTPNGNASVFHGRLSPSSGMQSQRNSNYSSRMSEFNFYSHSGSSQAFKTTSPQTIGTQSVSNDSFVGNMEDSSLQRSSLTYGNRMSSNTSEDLDSVAKPGNLSNRTSNQDASAIMSSNGAASSSPQLDNLRSENDQLKKKLKELEDSMQSVNITKKLVDESSEKVETYVYDIAKLKTDSARKEHLNTQLITFITQIMQKIPGYIDQKATFEELVGKLSIPQSAKESYIKALKSYEEADTQDASKALKKGATLSRKDIFDIFRDEVKLLSSKVQRLEEEKQHTEQILRKQIEDERRTIRKFSLSKKCRPGVKDSSVHTPLNRKRIASFRLINVVEPRLDISKEGGGVSH